MVEEKTEKKQSEEQDFENKDPSQKEAEISSEDILKQVRSFTGFLKKKKKPLLLFFLVLLPFLFGFSARINVTDLSFSEKLATDIVDRAVAQEVSANVAREFPHLTGQRRNVAIQKELQEYVKKNKGEYDIAFNRLEKQVKSSFQDPDGQTYLFSSDPYLWYHKTENILQHGHVGDTRKEKCDDSGICTIKTFDSLMLAPDGDFIAINLFPYFIAYLYRFLHFFNSNLSLLTVMFYIPAFLAALSVIPTFFITRHLTKREDLSFVAALIVGLHHAFIQRTLAGAADTDAFSVLFPLCIWWLLLIAMDIKTKKWSMVTLASLAGVGTGMFSVVWGGWWFIFDVFVISFIMYLVYHLLLQIVRKESIIQVFKKTQVRCISLVMALYITFTGILVTFFLDFITFVRAMLNPVRTATGLKAATGKGLWPNVYTTVTELGSLGLKGTLQKVGPFLIIVGAVGIVLALHCSGRKRFTWAFVSLVWYSVLLILVSFFNLKIFLLLLGLPFAVAILALLNEKSDQNIFHGAFLAVWFGGMVFASTTAQRFGIVLIPALAIGSAITFKYVYQLLSPLAEKHLSLSKRGFQPLFIAFAIMFIVFPITGPSQSDVRPIFDDGWYATLEKIDAESAPDAIIASWWDFGHFFKAIGNRKVIFDGGTQNRPQAHWMSKILINDDEDQAIAILRMLACGGNNAFDLLNEELKDTARSVKLLYTLFEKDKSEGLALLEKVTSKEKAQAISERVYCDPPDTYFIVSQDMINKMHAYVKFGFWDFDRAKIWNEARALSQQDMVRYLTKEFAYTELEALEIAKEVQKLSPQEATTTWITKSGTYGGDFGLCQDHPEVNTSYRCQLPDGGGRLTIDIDKITKKAIVQSGADDSFNSVVWLDDNGTYRETFNPSGNLGASLILIQDPGGVLVRSINPIITHNLLNKLLLFDAPGLSHFEKFDYHQATNLRGVIKTWKIIWDPKVAGSDVEETTT